MNENILNFFIKQKEQCQTPEVLKAIEEQERLSKEMMEKRSVYDNYWEQSFVLLQEGTRKLLEKYPELNKVIPKEDIKLGIIQQVLDVARKEPEKHSEILEKRKKISEFNEYDKIQPEFTKAFYEYIVAFSNFESKLKKDREELFSAEYKEKMAFYADEGLFLYYLETPDLPILDKDIQAEDIIDAFLYSDCAGLNVLLSTLLNMKNPGISMIRKQEDIGATIELINCGYYRSAVRNLFALLDSEHKKAANTYEGIVAKRKQYKKGHQRAQKIDELIDNTDDPWIESAWNKIDSYYQKVYATVPVEGVIHRNTIIHGDYDSNLIDVDKYSAVKLLLLYLNLRIIADYLCNKEEIFEEVLLYLPSIIIMLQEKPSDN